MQIKEHDKIKLSKQEVEVIKCERCNGLMVNLDSEELAPGDLKTLKSVGVVISNAETDKAVCIKCEYKTFGRKVADFFESDNDDEDDSSFFSPSTGGFLGGIASGGFGGFGGGGGFGGFGGGSFGGGGASRGF